MALFGSQTIKLRFDPTVLYFDQGQPRDNLQNFQQIATVAHQLGVDHITFAFCLTYNKVVSRFSKRGFTVRQLTLPQQQQVLDPLLDICQSFGIRMETCCNSQLSGYRGLGSLTVLMVK